MTYTTSKEADKKIEKDIQKIKENLIKEFNPKAIILFGGFGHGGGSFKKVKGRDKIIPLNDYDLYLITDKSIAAERLEEVGRKCSLALGRGGKEFVEDFNNTYNENEFFHVDLHSLPYRQMQKLYPTQRTFDLKTSTVIYGDKNILSQIPLVRISRSDALRLLFNKLDHFAISEGNTEEIKNIYAVKGFTDLCSAILIFRGKYVSDYQSRVKIFKELEESDIPEELKKQVEKATKAKLEGGYSVKDTEEFFSSSKEWVQWTLKKLLIEHLKSDKDTGMDKRDWKEICKKAYKKLPYTYFNDYLRSRYLFLGQYYLNIKFFLSGIKKHEFLIKSLLRWKDAGLVLGIAMILYSVGEEKEAERYLKKLTRKTKPLKERILKLYSIYYLQKLV